MSSGRFKLFGFAVFSVGVQLAYAAGTATLSGQVESAEEHRPLAGARVEIRGAGHSSNVLTAIDGTYRFEAVEPGTYVLVVTYNGHVLAEKQVVADAAKADEEFFTFTRAALGTVTLKEVTVTAQVTPTAMARAAQQDAPNLIDIRPVEEIRKLPDVNAAEAVRRIPGISLETDTGEGRFVNIRGLDADLNSTTFGGVRIPPTNTASPLGGGRAVAFDSIPAGLIGAITVTKTNLPEQDAEALGGTIEITPKQVPPAKDYYLDGHLGTGLETLRNSPIKDFQISGGGRFGFGDSAYKPFSFIGTAAWYEDHRNVDDIEAAYVDQQPTVPDKAFAAFEQRYYRYHRRRIGYGGELDFEPNTDNRWYVRYFDAGYTETVNRQRLLYNFSGNVSPDPANANGFIDPAVTFNKTLRDHKEIIDTRVLALGGENHLPSWTLDYRAALTIGSFNAPYDYNSTFGNPNAATVAYDNTSNPNFPRFNVGAPINPSDPANYVLTGFGNGKQNSHDQEWSGVANATIPTSFFAGDGENFKTGVSARLRRRHGEIGSFSYASVPPVPLGDAIGGQPVSFYDNHYQNGYNIDYNFMRKLFLGNSSLFPENTLVDAATDALGSTHDKENVYAAYGQYQFTPTDKLSVLAGVRWERTDATYGANAVLTDSNGNLTGVAPSIASRTYDNFFPTVQARLELSPSLVARAVYSRTIARPGFSQVSASININPGADSVTQGNPNLKPTTSDNIDVALEYYLDDGGILSLGLFNKALSDYIVNKQTTVLFPNNGLFAGFVGPAHVFTFDNINSAYARGLEFNYEQKFHQLPEPFSGLGVRANWTYVDSHLQIRNGDFTMLPSTSKNTANLGLSYDYRGLDLNLAAYYTSKNIFAIGGSLATDVYSQPRFSLDFGGSYKVNEWASVYFAAKNLTNTPLKFTEGPGQNRPTQREFYETTLLAGVRFQF
ncbi:TonB-dependent receptor [Dokdonella soli]|uniref:TonB-dependent receptor n=1 Tax=Dokdonella soli TaxID=529810 RepID=A0ABP3TTS6_9GAMM